MPKQKNQLQKNEEKTAGGSSESGSRNRRPGDDGASTEKVTGIRKRRAGNDSADAEEAREKSAKRSRQEEDTEGASDSVNETADYDEGLCSFLDECIAKVRNLDTEFSCLGRHVQRNPVVICGQDKIGDRVTCYLRYNGIKVVERPCQDVKVEAIQSSFAIACKSQPCVFLLKDIDQLDVSLLNEISSLMSSTAAAGDWIEFMGSSQHVTRVTGPTHKWLGVKLVEGVEAEIPE